MPSAELCTRQAAPETTAGENAFAASTWKPARARGYIDSHTLLQGTRELLIAHAGEEYRLRLTRNDKLILTK